MLWRFATQLTFALLLPVSALLAQGHPQPTVRGTIPSVTVGLGGGKAGLALAALVGFRRGLHEVSVRGQVNLKAGTMADRSESLVDAGFLYGLHPLREGRALALRAGVSGVWYTKDPGPFDPERTYDPTVGLPLEVALGFPASRTVALGLTVTGNLNRVRNYVAVLVTLTLGPRR